MEEKGLVGWSQSSTWVLEWSESRVVVISSNSSIQ